MLGFRYPAVWAFGIFTKVTPGIGLLWFLVRREWRNLGIALGLTAAIGAVSLLVDGRPLDASGSRSRSAPSPAARSPRRRCRSRCSSGSRPPRVVVAWGAWTDRRWTVPVAVTLALPVLWPSGFAVLAACLALSPMAGRPWFRLGRRDGGPSQGGAA